MMLNALAGVQEIVSSGFGARGGGLLLSVEHVKVGNIEKNTTLFFKISYALSSFLKGCDHDKN